MFSKMKPTALIVTEDISKTETFSGLIGKVYSTLYSYWLNFRLKIIYKLFSYKYKVKILATGTKFSSQNILEYSLQLKTSRLKKFRSQSWSLVNHVFKELNVLADNNFLKQRRINLTKIWETELAIKVSFNYLSYLDAIDTIVEAIKPDLIIVLGNSLQEKIAGYLAKKKKIKFLKLNLASLSFINNYLFIFFRNREIINKISNQLSQAGLKPKIKKQNLFLLSVDFYRHLKTLVPLYSYLMKAKKNAYFVTNSFNLNQALVNFNITNPNLIYLSGYLTKNYLSSNMRQWKIQTKRLLKKTKALFLKNTENDDDFIISLMITDLTPIIKYGFILSKICLEAGYLFFKQTELKGVVVVSDQRPVEVVLALMAKKFKVPSILVTSHTILSADAINRYNTTDKISVPGENTYKQLLSIGVQKNKINLCGDPSYEYRQGISRKEVFNRLGIKDLSKKIVLLTSFRINPRIPLREKQLFFQTANQAIKQIKSAILVVKPHPTEKRTSLQEEINRWGIKDVIISNNESIELFDLLRASSVVLITWSMTGFEAIMNNRPVIVVNTTKKNYDDFIPYISGKGAVQAENITKLEKYLESYLENNNILLKERLRAAQSFIKHYILLPDGKVCQRIIAVLLSRHNPESGSE